MDHFWSITLETWCEHSFAMVAAWQAADVVVLNKTDLATKDWQADCSDVGALGPYFFGSLTLSSNGEWLLKSQLFPSTKKGVHIQFLT